MYCGILCKNPKTGGKWCCGMLLNSASLRPHASENIPETIRAEVGTWDTQNRNAIRGGGMEDPPHFVNGRLPL